MKNSNRKYVLLSLALYFAVIPAGKLVGLLVSENHAIDTSFPNLIGIVSSFPVVLLLELLFFKKFPIKKELQINYRGIVPALLSGFLFICYLWLGITLFSDDKILDTSLLMIIFLSIVFADWVIVYTLLFPKKKKSE
jgi:hypothetical protein